jgi:hypothetical protein
MLTVVEQLVTEWFKDAPHGVNAIAAQLPRARRTARKDGAMVDDAPPTVDIYCAADSEKVRKTNGYRPAGEIPIAVFFMVDEAADDQAASDAAGYIMRACKLSLARFNSERLAGSARSLNDVKITRVVRVTEHRIPESNGRYKTPAFLEVIVAATDGFGSPTPATLGAFAAAG